MRFGLTLTWDLLALDSIIPNPKRMRVRIHDRHYVPKKCMGYFGGEKVAAAHENLDRLALKGDDGGASLPVHIVLVASLICLDELVEKDLGADEMTVVPCEGLLMP